MITLFEEEADIVGKGVKAGVAVTEGLDMFGIEDFSVEFYFPK